jgi:hypothetical protein
LHDAVTAERLGVPAIAVMTERFVSAAELMSRVLGMEGYQFAVIPHPVSSASDADLRAMAAMTLGQIRRLLLKPGSDGTTDIAG